MTGSVTESIYNGSVIVPLADVQHLEPYAHGLTVVTKHTRWNGDRGCWANPVNVPLAEAEGFKRAWCQYRYELEKDAMVGAP
jgi:hypothetical protein